MQGTRKGGYNNKISKFVVSSFVNEEKDDEVVLDVDEALAKKYAIALQSAWRSRTARILVSALKQEANCKHHRNTHPELIDNGAVLSVTKCDKCLQGDTKAEIEEKVSHQRYHEVEHLLFEGQKRMTVNDCGDNWNQRFQRIISLPEDSSAERTMKYSELYTLNKDFVNTATSYAQTIISEYFLHVKDKSIVAKNMGGIAGGQKYLWRGILFKMCDGSSGPYNGSDEAASKAAGHDLKGAIHYYSAGTPHIRVPLMALIDYKGFRMTAQAFLPLGKNSLVYGSADGGKTVLNLNDDFNEAMVQSSRKLNLRGHHVGGLGMQKELHAAVDIEGHVGMDGRFYLLDLARSFPPEAPSVSKHMDDILEDGTIVIVKIQNPQNPSEFSHTKGTVNRAYSHGSYYDILFPDGSIATKIPTNLLQSRKLSIFWRLLRPEFVQLRGTTLLPLQEEDIKPINSIAGLTGSGRNKEESPDSALSPLHISSVVNDDKPRMDVHSNGNGMGGISQEDETDYDDFDDGGSPSLPIVTNGGDKGREDGPGYDDFDDVSPEEARTENISAEKEVHRESAQYDTFDNTAEQRESLRESQQYDAFEGDESLLTPPANDAPACGEYGYFEGSADADDLGELPDSLPLKSTPSAIRMRRNSRFESTNFQDMLAYMNKYNHYDAAELTKVSEEEKAAIPVENAQEEAATVPSYDSILKRQAYIDTVVNEMYRGGASNSIPFSQDIVTLKMKESRRLRFDSSSANKDPSPCPLSPDALTAFSNFDPEAVDRNREVIRASERLVQEVVPALAQLLAEMNPQEVSELDVSVFLHYHGVNIRHLGLLRSHIPASNKTMQIRTKLLKQIVARTLKNICRDFQRRWMRSEQSSSDQGMFLLLTQFLNLIVGCHSNSEKFWEERVTVGIMQRYGKCALDGNESHMHRMRKHPEFLKKMVELFLSMMKVVLKPQVLVQFLADKNPYGFEFVLEDIDRIEPRVKYMHVVDYVSGVLMQERADVRAAIAGTDPRTVMRLRKMAGEHFAHAEKMLPSHRETCSRADTIKELNNESTKPKGCGDTCVMS